MTLKFDELRDEARDLGAEIDAQARRLDAPLAADRLADAVRRLAEGRLRVLVCGEYKRGKSTLLNALFHQVDPLLPVSVIPKTKQVTEIEYGPVEEYFAVEPEPEPEPEQASDKGSATDDGEPRVSRRLRRIERHEIERYAAEVEPDEAHRPSGTDAGPARTAPASSRVLIRLPDERLRPGFVVVDTPGVGGRHLAHSQITTAELATADAIVFVASHKDPLNEPELEFLARAGSSLLAKDTGDGLLILYNMIDLASDYSVELARARALAQERTRLFDDIPVVPVSAVDHLTYLETGDDAFLEAGRFRELETVLWERLLRRRIRVLLGEAAFVAEETVATLLRPLVDENRILRDDTGKELRRLTAECEQKRRRLAELADEGAAWRAEIREQLAALRDQMVQRCTTLIEGIWRRAETEMVEQQYYQIDPSRLQRQLDSEVGLVLTGVDDWAGRRATGIQGDCARRWQLSLGVPTLGRVSGISIVDLPRFDVLTERIRVETHRTPRMRIRTGERYETTRGDKPGMGRRLLVNVAGFFGARSKEVAAKAVRVRIVDHYEEVGGQQYHVEVNDGYSPEELARRRSELTATLARARANTAALVADSVSGHIATLSAAISLEMEREIALETETLGRLLPELEEAAVRTRETAQVRLDELEQLLNGLHLLQDRAQSLVRDVDELTKAQS